MKKTKLTEQDLTNIVKKALLEDDISKNMFKPRDLEGREERYQKMIEIEKEKIRKSPLGEISTDSLFEWIQENNLDQELKLAYKGPILGEVVGSSYKKSTGDVTLYLETKLGLTIGEVAIAFKISDIKIGLARINPEAPDSWFSPIN